MKITQRLNVEHGVFLSLLDRLDELVAQKALPEVLGGVTRTILAVTGPHCRIEDDWLYPTLREAFGRDFPPLTAVEDDHQEIRRLTRTLQDDGCEPAVVSALIAVLRRHIEKEIHLVFPLADEWIPDDTLAQMCDWYAEHVRDQAGRRTAVSGNKLSG